MGVNLMKFSKLHYIYMKENNARVTKNNVFYGSDLNL